MKNKKHQSEKLSERSTTRRPPSQPKHIGLTRRTQESKSKVKAIQITEPLDINPQNSSSKEFILSRESMGGGSRSALKDVNADRNMIGGLKSTQFKPYSKEEQQQQQMFDRRLSLKFTGNYSQQLDCQKSQRLSMAPLRRDLMATQNFVPHSLYDERESMSSIYQQSLLSESKSKQTLRKEAIISNLVNKLDNEADLKSIIENKLRKGSNSNYTCNKNQSYLTDFTDENNHQSMASKLKQCESEISYFKTVIRDMSAKIQELTEEKKFVKKKVGSAEGKEAEGHVSVRNRKTVCQNCCKKARQTKGVGIQTGLSEPMVHMNESYDFLDNLESTLQALGGHRG